MVILSILRNLKYQCSFQGGSELKTRIINSALNQIEKYGFRKFTLDDIADDLGISKKTVYKHFDSKNQLITEVIDSRLRIEKERTLRAINGKGSWLEKFDKVVLGHLESDRPKEHLLHELRRYFPDEWEKTKEMRRFKREQIKNLLEEGKRKGDIREDVHLETIVFIMDEAFNSLIDLHSEHSREISLVQALKEVKKLILFGILPNGMAAKLHK